MGCTFSFDHSVTERLVNHIIIKVSAVETQGIPHIISEVNTIPTAGEIAMAAIVAFAESISGLAFEKQ